MVNREAAPTPEGRQVSARMHSPPNRPSAAGRAWAPTASWPPPCRSEAPLRNVSPAPNER